VRVGRTPHQDDRRNRPVGTGVSSLYDRAGDPDAALAALRRRSYSWSSILLMPAYLALEGRMAEATGDRQGAIQAYRHYMMLRDEPHPSLRPEVRAVRDALARLMSE